MGEGGAPFGVTVVIQNENWDREGLATAANGDRNVADLAFCHHTYFPALHWHRHRLT